MSSISGASSSATYLYQMQQAAAAKQVENKALPTSSQQVQAAGNDPDHDGDSDGAGGIDTRA
jgi:hypothetical protein